MERCLALSFWFMIALGCQDGNATVKHDPALDPYLAFLRAVVAKPVDYVMRLFQKHDVVMLCERDHRDASQYDFIGELVADRRFITQVGHVCTEVGTSTVRPAVQELLDAPVLDQEEIDERVLAIDRNLTFFPIWENYNYVAFLRALARLDQSLEPVERVHLYPCDMPFNWEGMDAAKYAAFRKTLDQRDRVMADQVLATYRQIVASSDARKKLLVIMNYRHAFNDFKFADGSKGDNVGRYLFEALPERVANVWINFVALLPGTTDQNVLMTPVQDGRWDAAFAATGNRPVGFDFAGSPFGKDRFDLYPFRPHAATYEGVFTGMVFTQPIREFRLLVNVPGLFDAPFIEEFKRRMAITGKTMSDADVASFVASFGALGEAHYDELPSLQSKIDRWLR